MSSPSINASVNYNDKRKNKDWRYRTHNTDLLNPDENECDYKKNCLWRKKVLRNIQIRSMHEMGEIKRAQEPRIDGVSVHKLRENHDTIQQFTSQLQPNATTDEFCNWFCRFSRCGIKFLWKIVSRFQSACDDSEFSCFAQPRQKIAAWHMESIRSTGKRFWNSIFYVWFILRVSSNFIWCRAKNTVKQYITNHRGKQVWQVETDKIKAQFQCRHLRQGRWLWVPQYRGYYRRATWSDSKDNKYRNCSSTNSLIHKSFQCGKFDSKIKWLLVLIFHRMLCCGSKKWRWVILWTR